MLPRFNRIRTAIIKVTDQDGATVTVDRSDAFKDQAQAFERQLDGINQATVKLQKKKATLSKCRMVLDVLTKKVEAKKENKSSL